MKRTILSIAAILLTCCAPLTIAQRESETNAFSKPMLDGYYNIGNVHHEVSTKSPLAQTWFDRGIAMCYGFNHEEAVTCFENALEADENLAIAHAGMAYALGPNFNNMEITREQMLQAHQACERAKARIEHASSAERAIIEAIAKRSAADIPEDFELREPYNRAYADAMREVHRSHSDSPLVAELFAESLMNLQPWMHFYPDGSANTHTAEIQEVLESGLEKWPNHPGLCHLYIHLMEASPHPEKAQAAANALGDAVPGSGHLVHMPTHISVLLGDYDDVVKRNSRAIEVDKLFLEREGPLNFFSLYRIHNYHFLVYGAMFDGQSKLALEAARAINEQVPEEMLRGQVDFLDAFMPTAIHVLVRFGRWDDILNEPQPPEYLPMSRAIWHYARTLAYAATNRVDEAQQEREQFTKAVKLVPETSFLFQNASLDILGVAEAMIDGEIAYRKSEFDEAFDHLREAVKRDDALNYDEPWGWMQPTRHALGALLLEQGHYGEAEAVYREDLRRHPNNPWALHGLAEALAKQGKGDEASKYVSQFKIACERADVKINRSCFCRLNVATGE